MGKTNTEWLSMTDIGIVKEIGAFIKSRRLKQNKTQALLAKEAGLNRWTLSKIENGESVTLSSLIQILRALDAFYVLEHFHVDDEISPIEYAKIQRNKRQRARSKKDNNDKNYESEW